MRQNMIALVVLALAAAGAQAAEHVKVGLVSTLSGPQGAPGIDSRDGFLLAVKMLGGKLGDLRAEVLVADDQFNPETGKQVVERFVKRDRVDFVTGIIYSNVLLAAAPVAFDAKVPYVSSNAGPSQLAGSGCNPYFVSAAWQNDASHEASGQYATDKGFKTVYLLAPNYPAGKDALTGFKRFYKGKVVDEVYPKLGQLDFAAELAQVRAAKPDAVYAFMPGGMGINFIKQYVAAGLSRDIQLVLPGFSADQDTIRAVGEPMLGLFNPAHWSPDLDSAENRRFVAAFEKEYSGRIPSAYAAQGFDAALMIDGAIRAMKGKVADRDAVMRALKTGRYRSVRGDYKMSNNGFPIQTYYLRVVGKDVVGRISNKTMGTVFTNHADAYYQDCKLK